MSIKSKVRAIVYNADKTEILSHIETDKGAYDDAELRSMALQEVKHDQFDEDNIVIIDKGVTTLHHDGCENKGQHSGQFDCTCERRYDADDSWEDAQAEAARLNGIHPTRHFLACDAGDHCWPRYSVKMAPQVGDEVSYSFNGDTYPCGTITKISDSYKQITTSEGRKFYRRKLTGAWINNGTWSLVGGHRHEQNPHF